MAIAMDKRKRMYRVNLTFHNGMTRSVFLRAKDQAAAERRALRRHPEATGVTPSPFPQN